MVTVLKKKIMLFVAFLAGAAALTGCDDERKIRESQLPDVARDFISRYFQDEKILYAEKDRDDRVITYNVRLSDGSEIEFDESGIWLSVDCKFSPVPDGIVPAAILSHLETYVPGGTEIFKIEKEWGGYEVEISNGRDLVYDGDGNFVREQ